MGVRLDPFSSSAWHSSVEVLICTRQESLSFWSHNFVLCSKLSQMGTYATDLVHLLHYVQIWMLIVMGYGSFLQHPNNDLQSCT